MGFRLLMGLFLANRDPAQVVRLDLPDGFRRVVVAVVAYWLGDLAKLTRDGIGRNVRASAQQRQAQDC